MDRIGLGIFQIHNPDLADHPVVFIPALVIINVGQVGIVGRKYRIYAPVIPILILHQQNPIISRPIVQVNAVGKLAGVGSRLGSGPKNFGSRGHLVVELKVILQINIGTGRRDASAHHGEPGFYLKQRGRPVLGYPRD